MLRITIVTFGHKMPGWIQAGVSEYLKRLKEFSNCSLIEIPLLKRHKGVDLQRIMDKETALMQEAMPKDAYVIALAIDGLSLSSEMMSKKLASIAHQTSHLCFLIGAPEGLSPQILMKCHAKWSLSALTLPHPLARVVLLESLYRAFSINANHPYHK